MVHKKSEYRLQFRKLAEDLRKSIWEENVKFRELRRSVNQATHYWSYQLTDERCECEDDEDLPTCSPANGDAYQQSSQPQLAVSAKNNIANDSVPDKVHCERQAIALPSTSNGIRKEVVAHFPLKQSGETDAEQLNVKNRKEKYHADSFIPHESKCATKTLARKDGLYSAQASPEKNMIELDMKRNGVCENYSLAIPQKDAILSAREAAVQTPDWASPCCRSKDDWKEPKSGDTSRRSVLVGAAAPPNSPSQFSQSVLPRTTRRHHSEGRKAPFAMFGWNSTGNTIAEKKTHNVCAPEKEVHPEALLALRKRREQVERYLMEERKKRQQRMTSSTSSLHRNEVNHSSIWMSEYKDKFSQRDCKSEPFLLPCKKPPAAWRYR